MLHEPLLSYAIPSRDCQVGTIAARGVSGARGDHGETGGRAPEFHDEGMMHGIQRMVYRAGGQGYTLDIMRRGFRDGAEIVSVTLRVGSRGELGVDLLPLLSEPTIEAIDREALRQAQEAAKPEPEAPKMRTMGDRWGDPYAPGAKELDDGHMVEHRTGD